MANACSLASLSAIAACDAIVDRCEGGTPPAELVLYYSASPPTYADDAAGSEVATCICQNPAFGGAAADAGNHWAEADLDVTPTCQDTSATGNANAVNHFRIWTGTSHAVVLQGTAGQTSGYDLNLNAAIIGAGAQVDITALQVRVPYNQA